MTGARDPHASQLALSSDALLAVRAADGDARAFALLVRRHGRLLRSYAARVLGSHDRGDDAVQEALITAWQQLPGLEDRSAVRGWLVRIVTRKAVDIVRSERRHDDVEALDPPAAAASGPEQSAGSSALGRSLNEALTALPENQRRAWVLRELGGLGYDEIAEQLDLPVSTVRGLLARARRTLVARMEGWR